MYRVIEYGSEEDKKRDDNAWLLPTIPKGRFLSIMRTVEFWAIQMALGMVRMHYEPTDRCRNAEVSQMSSERKKEGWGV